jgi:putative membrane protein
MIGIPGPAGGGSGREMPLLPHAPQYIGPPLIAAGVLSLLLSIWQYQWTLHYLWSGSFASIAGM